MPWTTPTLRQVRTLVRDDIVAAVGGASFIANSALRIMADAQSGLAHLVLRYIDWLSNQFLPDSAEKEWLDRHGDIWLTNADSSVGRKTATLSSGTVTMTGTPGTVVAVNTRLELPSAGIGFETTLQITIGVAETSAPVRALDAGIKGNLEVGENLSFVTPIAGVDDSAIVVNLAGGTDDETDEELRARVLFRIQQPPMGGDASDYVAWALAVPGVTRAWSSTEMGIGTLTVRIMMDDLRASGGGFPTDADIVTVTTYIDTVRPVAIKDRWILSPIPEDINFSVAGLTPESASLRAGIESSVRAMLRVKAAPAHIVNGIAQPAQTIYAAWVSDAISNVVGVESFTLVMDDHPMPNKGAIGVLGNIAYD